MCPSIDLKGAQDWTQAMRQDSGSAIADSLAENVVLEATALQLPVSGKTNVKQVLEAASKIYETLEFTEQAGSGSRQYIEWRARAFGGQELRGVTVVTRDNEGAIARLAIHHRPMFGALEFSVTLADRLDGVIDERHFLPRSIKDCMKDNKA